MPVTPNPTNRNPPKYLTIAFFTQDYTVNNVNNLLKTVSVYRLFGPTVTGSITGGLNSINGLARGSSTPTTEMTSNSYTSSGTFSTSLNTSTMYSSPTNNTFTYGNSDSSNTFGSSFGAGYTLTCFYYNIFSSATLKWATPPANTATTCTIFGYVYNELESVGSNAYKNKQWMYTAFCPIDSTFNLQSSAANIDFLNPQYPLFFTNNFALRGVLTIAYSNQVGYLRAYRHETNAISAPSHTCTTAKLQPYNPSSSGKQRATFTLTVPAITMSNDGYSGYSSFRVYIAIPSTTISGSGISMGSTCDVSNPLLSCSVASAGTNPYIVLLTYTGSSVDTITYL